MITARQYGAMMRQQGVLWPIPAIDAEDMMLPDVSIYQIGQRSISNVFVRVRKNWATVYVKPAYTSYRAAFDAVMPRTSEGQDVDHLLPRSKGAGADFLALGRISGTSNRGWNDDESYQAMAQKVRNMPTASPHSFVSRLTDMERGWAVVTCYIRPFRELNQSVLTRVEIEAS
ncbi:hypothetical protein [uncultured Litoreibacter sp.]|uniref:hypothetical protein n=1 Tax=uncultured Litoreibacter sp. TaxID=1392394 RepID=UPI0026215D4D|nr:hypothetical protein [uncultured Litoreibacter sp.]